jgi:hypothetical protein
MTDKTADKTDRAITILMGCVEKLLDVSSTCTRDEEILENNRRRVHARRIIQIFKAHHNKIFDEVELTRLVEVCERFYNEQSVYYTKEKYEGFIK